jgi:hypothetical protein
MRSRDLACRKWSQARRHATGTVLIPDDRIQAIVYYTAHASTHGHLREPGVVAAEPVGSDGRCRSH